MGTQEKPGGREPAQPLEPMPLVYKLPGWMSRKYGSDRHFPAKESAGCALLRAKGLATELAYVSEKTESKIQPVKNAQWVAGRQNVPLITSAEVRPKSWHCGKCALPLDFEMFDFAYLEESTRKLFYVKDDWLYQDEAPPRMTDRPERSIQHGETVDKWRAAYSPQVNEKLVPFINEMMDSGYGQAIWLVDSSEQTLHQLIDGEALGRKTMDVISLAKSKARTNGRARNVSIPKVTYGPRVKCLEFKTQDVSFGSLRVTAIDMGAGAKINLRTQRVLGSESVAEGNQCVLKHVAMGLEWLENKRHVRIPSRNRAGLLGSELRMGGTRMQRLVSNELPNKLR